MTNPFPVKKFLDLFYVSLVLIHIILIFHITGGFAVGQLLGVGGQPIMGGFGHLGPVIG